MITPVDVGEAIGPSSVRQRLEALEDTFRATLNILTDYAEEKASLRQFQQAIMNILADFDDERHKSAQLQRATLNLLEDMHEERNVLSETQRSLLNILDDAEAERERAERARAELETANKELEAFSYSVSHDLRAPLRAISGFAEAVLEDHAPRLDDEGKRYLRFIEENVHKMGELIDDLLRFSRLSRQWLSKTGVDVDSLARETFAELRQDAPGRDIEFVLKPVPPARADVSMLRQVLLNLLSNAIKFTRPRDKAVIEFGYAPEVDGGAYYVRDNGIGFDMRYADKLFGVFQRLHSETEFEGTGVGLALVKRVVVRHGGRVWAEAEVDRGATFFFTLPADSTGR